MKVKELVELLLQEDQEAEVDVTVVGHRVLLHAVVMNKPYVNVSVCAELTATMVIEDRS